MSASTQRLATGEAAWKQLFAEHIDKLPSPEFVLGTLHATAEAASGFVPRVRYCIYRGMWAELPENKHNDAPRNARLYGSDLPTFTTDVRMDKVADLFATGPGHGDASQAGGTGGGGAVEAVFWISEAGSQWRIRGTGWVVGPDVDTAPDSSGVRSVKSVVGERMRLLEGGQSKSNEWSWSRELTAHFGNCSPGMRGTWRNPAPGTPAKGEPDAEHQLGQKVTDLEDPIARANFRVVIIVPDEVERTDISDPAKARRWRYTFVREQGEQGESVGNWHEQLLWP